MVPVQGCLSGTEMVIPKHYFFVLVPHKKRNFFPIKQLRMVHAFPTWRSEFDSYLSKATRNHFQRCCQVLTVAQLIDTCYFTQKHWTYQLFSWSGPVSNKLESNTNSSWFQQAFDHIPKMHIIATEKQAFIYSSVCIKGNYVLLSKAQWSRWVTE